MAQPLLELRGVNKSFGVAHVLHDVDFAVYPGQVTALVGDNGAGKSTLVKIIAGIYGRDTGDYLFEGQAVNVHGPRDVAACLRLKLWDEATQRLVPWPTAGRSEPGTRCSVEAPTAVPAKAA